MKKNLLVTLADKNYIQHAKQLFSSVYWNAGWNGDYMLLAHEIPEEELVWFTSKGILVKRCRPLYDKHIGKENYPPVVFNIFYLFTPEFRKWKNIVFLDGDIIVRASLNALTKIKGLASPNVVGDKLKYFFYDDVDVEQFSMLEKNYNLNLPAFNCAVMAFSTDIIRDHMMEELMLIYQKYCKISSGTDPTLNQFFYKKWKKLPVIYDITPEKIQKHTRIPASKLKGIIIHLRDNELSDKTGAFYKEWETNLKKAELIDIHKVQNGNKWHAVKIILYSFYIRLFYKKFMIQNEIKPFIFHKLRFLMGKIGILIKRFNPALYYRLKKAINGK
jgi:lipopolysaccharide biosynthesis glycosyltransferase